MRPDLETYYLIDQYLENKLKGEELIAFENQLSQDASFAKEVEEQRLLNDYILEAELKSVRDQIGKDLINIQKPSFFRMHWQWIGVGLLSLSGILYFTLPSKEGNKTVQQSIIHTVEHNDQPVIEAASIKEKTPDRSTNIIESQTQSSNTPIEIVQTKPAEDVVLNTATTAIIAPVTNQTDQATTAPSNISEAVKKDDCSAIKIAFSLTTETSCANSETGAIHIDKISGGNAPYSFALNNKKIKDKSIADLGAGIYEVKISDKNGCFTTHTATVSEKNCTPALQQGAKFNINPTIGETCNIPFDTDKKGNVTIYNRAGKIIYRATNPSSDSVEWTGADGYGALAEAGLYVYIIEYTDGTKITGEVNIIR